MYSEKLNKSFPPSTPLRIHASMLLPVFTLLFMTALPAAALASADCYSFKACADLGDAAEVPKKALTYYDKALELWLPADGIEEKAVAHNNRGARYKVMKKEGEAVKDFSRAIELTVLPAKKSEYYTNRACAYESLEFYSKAIEDFGKAIQLTPQEPLLYGRRAGVYAITGEYAKALPDYKKAGELEPSASFSTQMGNCYFHLGQYHEAVSAFTRAIAGDPANSYRYEDRARAYAALKDYKKAAADYAKALELSPAHLDTYNLRGSMLWLSGRKTAAKKDFSKAAEKAAAQIFRDQTGFVRHVRGIAYMWLGKCAEARDDLEQAAAINGKWNSHMEVGAWWWFCGKNREKALKSFRKGAEIARPKGLTLSVTNEFLRDEINVGYFIKDLRNEPEFRKFLRELNEAKPE